MTEQNRAPSEDGQAGVKSKEVPLGDLGDPLCELDEALERFNNRLTVDNLALAKRYLEGELWVGLGLAGLGGGQGKEYRVVLHREPTLRASNIKENGPLFEKPSHGFIHVSYFGRQGVDGRDDMSKVGVQAGVRGPHRYDRLVFVEQIESVEFPEGFVPTWVWLEPLGERDRFGASPLHPFTQDLGLEVGWVFGEREVRVFRRATIGCDQRSGQEVKRGSQVVDDVADDGAPVSGNTFRHLNPEVDLSGLAVLVYENAVGFAPMKGFNLPLQVTEVCFSSIDLHPHPLEGILN